MTPNQKAALAMRNLIVTYLQETAKYWAGTMSGLASGDEMSEWISQNLIPEIEELPLPPAEPDRIEAMRMAREALKPFAAFCARYPGMRLGEELCVIHDPRARILSDDFKRAADAFAALDAVLAETSHAL